MSPRIFLAMPQRDGVVTGVISAVFSASKTHTMEICEQSGSLLATVFNQLWCKALNSTPRPTHFVMLHNDIVPEPLWLDKMLHEFNETQADILSSVIPIKDERGVTSTAFMNTKDRRMRRLVMNEIDSIPTTFNGAMVGLEDWVVLPNTGLMMVDFTGDWVEDVCFHMHDRINRNPDGKFEPQTFGEDWMFGLDAWRLGLNVFATKAIKAEHKGVFGYPNYAPWGTLDQDNREAIFDPPEYAFGAHEQTTKKIDSSKERQLCSATR